MYSSSDSESEYANVPVMLSFGQAGLWTSYTFQTLRLGTQLVTRLAEPESGHTSTRLVTRLADQ